MSCSYRWMWSIRWGGWLEKVLVTRMPGEKKNITHSRRFRCWSVVWAEVWLCDILWLSIELTAALVLEHLTISIAQVNGLLPRLQCSYSLGRYLYPLLSKYVLSQKKYVCLWQNATVWLTSSDFLLGVSTLMRLERYVIRPYLAVALSAQPLSKQKRSLS